MPSNVLLIDDDILFSTGLLRQLSRVGISGHHAATVDEGFKLLDTNTYSSVVVEAALPDRSGFEVPAALRATGSDCPVIILSGRSNVETAVLAYRLGADLFVPKPVDILLFSAQLAAIEERYCRLTAHRMTGIESFSVGGLEINFQLREYRASGKTGKLTGAESKLLKVLYQRMNQPVSRQELLDQVWPDNYDVQESAVNAHVQRLRRKLEVDPSDPKILVTEHGTGYRLLISDKI